MQDEGGGNRNNNNRLMDTQNNAKGGYGYGGSANNQAAPLSYMVGSELSTLWTSQHSCGSENNECQIVIQAMCNSGQTAPAGVPNTGAANAGEGPIRDGTDNGTPDPNNPDASTGLHEPASFYADCDARERNGGLYTADQNMNNNNGARATRQNPNGNRSGQECPEERDYYPYWHPSPWKDVAIVTNNLALCSWYQQESQNVKAKNYCSVNTENNQADCTANGGQWLEQPAFGIPPPECIVAPFQRDNHLGDGPTGHEVGFNWTIPTGWGTNGGDDVTNCVARFRYNITTSDTRVCSDSSIDNQAACEAQGLIWSAAYLDSSYNNLVNGNNNAANGNQQPALLEGNPDVDMDGFLQDTGGTNSMLELAINTNQYGRTFQDRTHIFSMQSRPPGVSSATKIYNLNVKGKRGNIVQTYPATEYDFAPNELVVGANDMVHVQWTGNDNTNNNGNNNGEGTINEDRHNMVQLGNAGLDVPLHYSQTSMFDLEWEWNPESTSSSFGGARAKDSMTEQAALVKQTGCLLEGQINNDQQRQNCQKLNAAAATVDLGLLRFKPGEYKYMSSRNNNFANRGQKAKLTVLSSPSVVPRAPVDVQVVNNGTGGSCAASTATVEVTWSPPGSPVPFTGSDGKLYRGYEQENTGIVDYRVQISSDSGSTWTTASMCSGSGTYCTVTGLPTSTNLLFKVLAGSVLGGYSDGSLLAPLTTSDSPCSDVLGCTYPGATNYDSTAATDDGSCLFDCVADGSEHCGSELCSGTQGGHCRRLFQTAIPSPSMPPNDANVPPATPPTDATESDALTEGSDSLDTTLVIVLAAGVSTFVCGLAMAVGGFLFWRRSRVNRSPTATVGGTKEPSDLVPVTVAL